jgi:MYXO-CTERM domain-containing protein
LAAHPFYANAMRVALSKRGQQRLVRTCGLWVLFLQLPASAQLAGDPNPSVVVDVQPRVELAFAQQERVHVFLILRDATAFDATQDALIATLGAELTLGRRYRNIPAIAGELSRAGLARARSNPALASVQLDGVGSGGLAQAVPAAGVDKVQSMRGLTGKGITVAVIDSGATTTHPALAGAIIGQHCFTQFDCGTFQNEGDSAEDDHNHGSNVTGIVASRGGGGVAKGYAPGSSIVAVKVLDGNNSGQISDWVAGFDWLFSNMAKFELKVINASLVSTAEYATAAQCDGSETALAMITKKLIDAGVTITGASGNTGHTATMTAPACNSGVIAVGATYDSDLGKQPESGATYQTLGGGSWPACSDATTNTSTIACFTSTAGARLDLLAPGSQITSTGKGTGTSLFRGTSQAAPGVAGLAALMLECNPMLTPAEILDVLKMSGAPVMDPRSGMSYPLIRGLEAVDMACPMGMAGSGGSAAGAGGSAAGAGGMSGAGASGSSGAGAGAGGMAGGSAAGAAGASTVPPATIGGVGSAVGSAGATAVAGAGVPIAGATAGLGPGTGGMAAIGGTATAGVAAPRPVYEAPESGCGCEVPGSHARSSRAWTLLVLLALVAGIARRRRTFTHS